MIRPPVSREAAQVADLHRKLWTFVPMIENLQIVDDGQGPAGAKANRL